MKKWNFLVVFVILLFSGYSEAKIEEAPVTLTFEKGEQNPETNYYQYSFLIKNSSDKPLENNWEIYFCQLPLKIIQSEEAPVKIKAVNANYFKMYPTSTYRSIGSHDSLLVSISYTKGLLKVTQAPEGAYMIVHRGKHESVPLPVKLKIVPFATSIMDKFKGVEEGPFSDGMELYKQNQLFTSPVSLTPADMIPGVKNVVSGEGQSLISDEISLNYEKAYSSESTILTEKLKELYGINVGNHGKTSIRLTRLPGTVIPVNEEYYQLSIKDNTISIQANTTHAMFDGIQTFLDLLKGKTIPCNLENLSIIDYPDLMYRGFMLDIARDFTTKNNLIKLLDEMSAYKMTVLHLHFSDDEGWRIAIPGLEELTSVGGHRGHTVDETNALYPAYDGCFDPGNLKSVSNGFYSRKDFIEILKFAATRHIQIIPEIETPGHSRAAIVSMKARYKKYAEKDVDKAREYLLSDPEDTSVYVSAQYYVDNVMNVALPSTYHFLDKVIKEIAAMYREANVPLTTIHIGGDEVPNGAWLGSGPCQALMKTNKLTKSSELEGYYFKQIGSLLQKHQLKMSGWQEIALNHTAVDDSFFTKNSAFTYCWRTNPEWGTDEIPYNLANKGYHVILSNVNNLYLDLAYNKHPNEPGLYWGGFVDEQKTFSIVPFSIYRSLRTTMSGKPVDVVVAGESKEKLTAEGRKHIIGIQAQLFSETLRNFDMVQYYMFPKILGCAERAWNAEPSWSLLTDSTSEQKAYESDLMRYHAMITQKEMPYWNKLDINFQLPQPGIYVKDGFLYANSSVKDAEIRYTIDNAEPSQHSLLWQGKVPCNTGTVKAKLFYLGKESVTTTFRMK